MIGRSAPDLHGVPVTPGAGEARRWLIDELAKPAYQAAKPTWFDRASNAVWTWFTSLFSTHGPGHSGYLAAAIAIVALALIVTAIAIFGRPKLNRRTRLAVPVISGDDLRDSRALRHAAADAARSGDWTRAVEDAFRAIARDLDERTLIVLRPGTTAQEITHLAAQAFPELARQLSEAARSFDSVRYLGKTATGDDYDRTRSLDEALRARRRAPDTTGSLSGTLS